MNYRRSIVSSLLTLLSNESLCSAAAYFDEKDEDGNIAIRTLEDRTSAIAAASRDDVCTIILFGAPWDIHFNLFVKRGHWHELADLVRDDDDSIELAFFQYHVGLGSTGPGSIPPELLDTPTIGSYDWYAYRGGTKLREDGGATPTRKCRNNDWDRMIFEWDVGCFKRWCRLGAGRKVPTAREPFEIL
jgi:hypothetical protein